jgi:uncharacterized protein
MTILVVPGLNNSGPAHWQSWFENIVADCRRVEQRRWDHPDLDTWGNEVAKAIVASRGPVWIVAHSFGCLASVFAARQHPGRVRGALLVAPADPQRFAIPGERLHGALPFPSLLVASTNDPWVQFASAEHWAGEWGCELIDVGPLGHINADSGHGPWPAALDYYQRLHRQAHKRLLHAGIAGFPSARPSGFAPAPA